MSLKTKFLVVTIAGNAVVLAFLCGTLIYLELNERRDLQSWKAQFAARTIQERLQQQGEDGIGRSQFLGRDESNPQRLRIFLSTSELLHNWIVTGQDNRILVKESPEMTLSSADRQMMQKVRRTREVMINQQRVYFPIMRRDGHMLIIATNLQGLSVQDRPYRIVLSTAVIMGLGTILLALILFLLYDHILLNPLSRLVEATKKIADSDYSHRIDETNRTDEIGELTSAFNLMMDELESFQKNLQEKVDRTKEKMKRTQRHLIIAQRLTSMGNLASGIAHEINNPLGGMQNALRSLREKDLSDQKREEYFELIERGLDRIRNIVQKVLDFSPSKENVEVKEMDLIDTLESVLHLEQHRIREEDIRVDSDLPDEPIWINAAPMEIQQAIFNVFKNAIEAVMENDPDEPRWVELSVEKQTDEEQVVVEIRDSGPGMTDEMEERAFDPFFTSKEDEEGSGLGLSISHQIVQDHGGTIEILSNSERGTTVRISIPRYPETDDGEENVRIFDS